MNAFFSLWVEKFHDSFLAIFIYFHAIATIMTVAYVAKPFGMDSKPLTQQSLFWLAIIIPIFSFLYFGIFSWYPFEIQLGGENYKNFIVNNAFPLSLLSLSIPFTAIVNNIHRTIQTDAQINQTHSKNSFDFYLNHKKSTVEYFSSSINYTINLRMFEREPTHRYIPKKVNIVIGNPYKLYDSLFILSKEKNIPSAIYGYSTDYIEKIKNDWLSLDAFLLKNQFDYRDNSYSFNDFIRNLELKIVSIMEKLCIDPTVLEYHTYVSIEKNYTIPGVSTKLLSNKFTKELIFTLYSITNDLFLFTDHAPLSKTSIPITMQYIEDRLYIAIIELEDSTILDEAIEKVGFL